MAPTSAPEVPLTAVQRVFGIVELVEKILHDVPTEEERYYRFTPRMDPAIQLFQLQRVNHAFKSAITGSIELRKKMETPIECYLGAEVFRLDDSEGGFRITREHLPHKVGIHELSHLFGERASRAIVGGDTKQSWTSIRVNAASGPCVQIRDSVEPGLQVAEFQSSRETTWGEVFQWQADPEHPARKQA
ncbi:hypothetical protein Slin15195_G120130 [Septoria linicola]|uniref:Uncharacterized protein n=1 Tax=Septoria linicola TaxID=215465 RepID=A0A9Q9EQF2_9PEZI|nr:hypothetical protein Slin14017_G097110 [Septoria linicola]USW58694.1 hypothetical protein Slin15195_G120130 [Septoria linicola]